MKKDAMLAHWQALEAGQPLHPVKVPYKHKGSTYAEDGLRITGSKVWIDSVLSRLKDLLDQENAYTRLAVAYQQSKDKDTGAPLDSFNCYVQVHERGGEAVAMNLFVKGIKSKRRAA